MGDGVTPNLTHTAALQRNLLTNHRPETVKKHRPLLSLSKEPMEPIDHAALFSPPPPSWMGGLFEKQLCSVIGQKASL